MNFTSVPIIVVCSYIVGELYKQIFKKKTDAYRFIPVLLSIVGGILGVVIYFTNPEMIFNAANVWIALGVGIVSGVSATGANQIIKQLFLKQKNVNDTNDTEDKSDGNS